MFIVYLFLLVGLVSCISEPRSKHVNGRSSSESERNEGRSVRKHGRDLIGGAVRIPFFQDNGVLSVNASINGSPIKFIFDSGASDVTISLIEANHLFKNGILTKEDFTVSKNYIDANGDVNEGAGFMIDELKFGSALLRNIEASVVNSNSAPNLLGQSALERFGKVSIDYTERVIIVEPK
jgi:aspartyl protease family protein